MDTRHEPAQSLKARVTRTTGFYAATLVAITALAGRVDSASAAYVHDRDPADKSPSHSGSKPRQRAKCLSKDRRLHDHSASHPKQRKPEKRCPKKTRLSASLGRPAPHPLSPFSPLEASGAAILPATATPSPEHTVETSKDHELSNVSPPVEPIVESPNEEATSGEPGPIEAESPAAPFRFFAADSFWNAAVPSDAPLESNSRAVVEAFNKTIDQEEEAGNGPWINTSEWSVPIYTVPAGQPTVSVQLHEHVAEPALSSAWDAVPLPPGAKPAAGTDGTLVIWQPSTDRLWEFHRLVHQSGEWSAEWGGAMEDTSANEGVFGSTAWAGAEPWWGASASSLSLVGGLVTLEDLEAGEINHALDMAIPEVRAGVFSSPAHRTDGQSSSSLALPEGSHLRLNPSLNLAALHLPPITLMLAEAAQRYGIFVSDYSPIAEIFAQDPTPTGTNPYTGATGYFEGRSPAKLLASFPWSQLELLKMELHTKTK